MAARKSGPPPIPGRRRQTSELVSSSPIPHSLSSQSAAPPPLPQSVAAEAHADTDTQTMPRPPVRAAAMQGSPQQTISYQPEHDPNLTSAPSLDDPGTTTSVPPDLDRMFTALHGAIESDLELRDDEEVRNNAILLHEAAQLEELVFGDPARASCHYAEAVNADPCLVPALRALRRQQAVAGRWEDYARALAAEIAVAGNDALRAALLTQQGEAFANYLSSPEKALESLSTARALAPHMRSTLEALRRLFLRGEQWQDLTGVLADLGNLNGDNEQSAHLAVEAGQLFEHRLQKPEQAEVAYARALSLNPGNLAADIALRRLYQKHGRWAELSRLMRHAAGRAGRGVDQVFAETYRAAQIARFHLEDLAQAAVLFEAAAELRPNDATALIALTDVYPRLGQHQALVDALSRLSTAVPDTSSRSALNHRIGRVTQQWLDQPQQAISAYQQALHTQVGHDSSLRALARLYQQTEQWSQLLELEEQRADRLQDSETRHDAYLRAASICETRLREIPRAIELYRRAWQLKPGSAETFRALDRLYRACQKWDALVELYRRKAELTKDTSLKLSLLRSSATVLEQQLEDLSQSVELLETISRSFPDDRESLIHRCRLYEQLGRFDDLRLGLLQWAKVTEDAEQAIELKRRVARLLEGPLDSLPAAIALYEEILRTQPSDRVSRQRLQSAYDQQGRHADLAHLYREELAVTADAASRAALQVELGRVSEEQLGDLNAAESAYRDAIANDETCTPALIALEQVLRRREDWRGLVGLLSAQADQAEAPGHLASLLCQAGELCEEKLGNGAEAARYYARALEVDGSCLPARDGLERLYISTDDHAALESHYLREAEQTQDPQLRVEAYLRLGSFFAGPGADAAGAIRAYESALRIAEGQPDAVFALTELHRCSDNWERLSELLLIGARHVTDPATIGAMLREWVCVVTQHLPERWDTVPTLRQLLETQPDDLFGWLELERKAWERNDLILLEQISLAQIDSDGDPTLRSSMCMRVALTRLLCGKVDDAIRVLQQALQIRPKYLPAIYLLRRLAERQCQWAQAAELLLRQAELAPAAKSAAHALLRAGDLFAQEVRDVPRARRVFSRLLEQDPSHREAFERMSALLLNERDWAEFVALYRRRLEVAPAEEKPRLWYELARIHRHELDDIQTALELLEQLLDADANNAAALRDAAQLCIEQRRWNEASNYFEKLVACGGPEQQRYEARLEWAQLLNERLGDDEKALQVLQGGLADRPGDRETLRRCSEVYRRRNDWPRVVEVFTQLAASGELEQRIESLLELASLNTQLSDLKSARHALQRAIGLAVDSGVGMARLEQHFAQGNEYELLAELLAAALEALPLENNPAIVPARLFLAQILAERLLRPAEAETEIGKALRSAPNSLQARLALGKIHLSNDNLDRALEEYQRVLRVEALNAEAFRGIYQVFERRGDLDRAASAAQVICAVGVPDAGERKIAAQIEVSMEASLAATTATPLDAEGYWELLAHEDEPVAARQFLLLVADYIPQVLAERLSVAEEGLFPLDESDALATRCAAYAAALGIERLQCCTAKRWPTICAVLPASPPA